LGDGFRRTVFGFDELSTGMRPALGVTRLRHAFSVARIRTVAVGHERAIELTQGVDKMLSSAGPGRGEEDFIAFAIDGQILVRSLESDDIS